jgi:dolichol-phosphate mannosyltransferase
MGGDSLPGWNLLRRSLTHFGHVMTRWVLRIRYDATGAFRAYRLNRIPRGVFALVSAQGYAFFFDSMLVFDRNGIRIGEIPIVLPSRTYGHSKMSIAEAARSGRRVFDMFTAELLNPSRFRLPPGDRDDPKPPQD